MVLEHLSTDLDAPDGNFCTLYWITLTQRQVSLSLSAAYTNDSTHHSLSQVTFLTQITFVLKDSIKVTAYVGLHRCNCTDVKGMHT